MAIWSLLLMVPSWVTFKILLFIFQYEPFPDSTLYNYSVPLCSHTHSTGFISTLIKYLIWLDFEYFALCSEHTPVVHVPLSGTANRWTQHPRIPEMVWPAQGECRRSPLPWTGSFHLCLWNRVPFGGMSSEISCLPLNQLNIDVLVKTAVLVIKMTDWLKYLFQSVVLI